MLDMDATLIMSGVLDARNAK